MVRLALKKMVQAPPMLRGRSLSFFRSPSFALFASSVVTLGSPALADDAAPPPAVHARPDSGIGAQPSDVFSEDWWGAARPILELHGYFRTRAEFMHNFSLGRKDVPGGPPYLWPQPLDNSYTSTAPSPQGYPVTLCGTPSSTGQMNPCSASNQSTANLRLRVVPELHISDNLRLMAQIDALDNMILGSTPESFAMRPAGGDPVGGGTPVAGRGGYVSAGVNPYAPIAALSSTQGPPTAGINSLRNSIDVKRVWGEYATPLGQLRFGRMPFQWGLGMLYNAGDSVDSDYQTTYDRIMFVTGVRSLDLYAGGSWDFMSTGPTNQTPYSVNGGEPVNLADASNLGQWSLFVARRANPEMQKLSLARGNVVINAGVLAMYRRQLLDTANRGTPQTQPITATPTGNNGFERRGAYLFTPDVWLQVMWRKLRFEAEFAAIWGMIDQTLQTTEIRNSVKVRQFGLATETEYRAIEDKLRIGFGFGWASGDPWAESLNPGAGGRTELNRNRGPMSTFSFHPDYRVDMIFFRRILSRVEGAYYFKPNVSYDFVKHSNGQKFGGGAAIVWSRASEFVQTPGHKRDLGVELDFSIYYQAKDGALNDNPEKLGGFFAMLQYGVFFPLGGLSYLPEQLPTNASASSFETSNAQMVRLFLGIAY